MKAINLTFKNIMIVLMVIVVAFLLRVFVGVNFWMFLGLVAFFAACGWLQDQTTPDPSNPRPMTSTTKGLKTLASVARVLVILVLIGAIVEARLPRFFKSKETALAQVDQFSSGLMGSKTKTMARDIWNIQEEKAGKAFLGYYKNLLSQGLTKEAADTLAGFNSHWDTNLLKDKEDQSLNSAQPVQSVQSIRPVPSQARNVSAASVSVNTPTSESFTFTKEGETWHSTHSFQEGEQIIYVIEGDSVFIVDGDNNKTLLAPGRYGGPTIKAGVPHFVVEKVGTKVTVLYSEI